MKWNNARLSIKFKLSLGAKKEGRKKRGKKRERGKKGEKSFFTRSFFSHVLIKETFKGNSSRLVWLLHSLQDIKLLILHCSVIPSAVPHDLKWLLKLQPSCLHSNEQERGKGDRLVLNALSRMHGRKITTLEVTSHLFKKNSFSL